MRKLFSILLLLFAEHVCAALPTATNVAGPYTCNGVTTAFSVPFKFLANSDLLVTRTTSSVSVDLTLTTHYTVTGAGGSSGTVNLVSGSTCGSGSTLTIRRIVPLTQPSTFSTGNFNPKSYESALDRLAMQTQQTDSRTTDLCNQVDQVLSLAQGPMGPKGADGSISNITQDLNFTNTYRATNLAAPSSPNDSARLTDVTSLTDGSASIPSWVAGTWIISGTPNGNYIYKQPNGLITLILWVTAGASPPATVLTLPAAWRPVQTLRAAGLDGAIGNKPVWFEINGSGPVYIYGENIPAAITGHTYHLAVTYKGT